MTHGRIWTAAGISVLLHAALIGGSLLNGSGRGGSSAGSESKPTHEIAVKIRTAIPGTVEQPRGPDRVPSDDAAQSDRVRSRSTAARVQAAIPAQRVLEDPAAGLVFSVYFKAVKAILVRQAARESAAVAPQELPVRFVLERDGHVGQVMTPAGTSPAVQAFAEQLVASAGPFPPFPSSIRHASISFDVLFRFDGNVLG